MRLKSIKKIYLQTTVKYIIIMPIALLGRIWAKDVWIITERPDQARDNGYCFYRYLREKHSEQKVIYIIDKKASDYNKLKRYKSVIQFDSLAHYYFYCLAKIHISAHVGGCVPSGAVIAKYLKSILKIKDVFIPHGVSYGIAEFCLKKYAKIDLFICSGKPEYNNIINNYGYDKSEVAYTGFPRLDQWHDIHVDKKQLLFMPTWRMYIAQNSAINIYETEYYKVYQSVLNNKELHGFLKENDLELVFYLHHNMQKFIDAFSTQCSNIKIVQESEKYDIQELLKTSAILITDYSSVHFDFAYMNKPVIYFQFDEKDFYEKQYTKSFFDVEKDGFGRIAYTTKELIKYIKQSYLIGFVLEEKYFQNMRTFYELYDNNNSKRVFESIKERLYDD